VYKGHFSLPVVLPMFLFNVMLSAGPCKCDRRTKFHYNFIKID